MNFQTPEYVDYLDAADYAHDMIGNLNAGMNRWIDWNFLVDKDGGPRHVPMGFTSGLIVDDDFHYRKPIMYTTSATFPNILLRVQNASAGANTEQTWM